jgi:Legume lectin domain
MAHTGILAGRAGGPSRAVLARGLGKAILGLALWIGCTASAHAQQITLNGSASLANGVLRLTPADFDRAGSAWRTAPQSVQGGFETAFQFRITGLGGARDTTGATGGDGFAFVIQNSGLSALGICCGGIGYLGIPNSLAVEFDTWPNPEFGDPNGNHVSVHTRGTAPNDNNEAASIGLTTAIPYLSDGRTHYAVIRYTSPSDPSVPSSRRGILQVDVDGTRALAIRVDLGQLLSLTAGRAFVGFTAGTGGAFENHDILSWSLRSF